MGEKIAACLESGLGSRSLADPEVRQVLEVGRPCPRKVDVVYATTSDEQAVDVHADVEPARATAASCRRTEPDGDHVPAVVGQLATLLGVLVEHRCRLEDFDVRTTMPASIENAQPQFVAPTTRFHLQQPVHIGDT